MTAHQSTEVVLQTGTEVAQHLVVRQASQPSREARSFCWAGGAGGIKHNLALVVGRASTAPASPASSASPVHRDGAQSVRVHREEADTADTACGGGISTKNSAAGLRASATPPSVVVVVSALPSCSTLKNKTPGAVDVMRDSL